MRGFKRTTTVLIVLFVALVVLAFVLENQQNAALSIFGWSTPPLPISVFVVISLIGGMIVGPFLGVVVGRGGRRS